MGKLGTLLAVYLVIGGVIVGAQAFTGTHCDPDLTKTVPHVTKDYPPGLISILLWPLSAYQNLWVEGVPLQEYLSPSVCVDKN